MRSDLTLFLRQLIRRPQATSALAPSSSFLAAAMTRGLGPDSGRIAEFGPGTGALTRAILGRGVRPADLDLFEMNPVFADHLRGAFPGVTVHTAPAQEISRLCAPGFSTVISGLPLLSIPEPIQKQIFEAAFASLAPGGRFVQFTYGPRPPLVEHLRAALDLAVERGPKVWANLPPARVYVYLRAADGMRRYAN